MNTDENAPHKLVLRQIREQSRQQWQPIETHPKNGKEFMCIDTDGNIDIQWHPMVPAPEEYTHWMALPTPPKP